MKTQATIEIFDFLMSKFSIGKSQIVDFWDIDNCAFGINNMNNTILIYISTFNKEVNNYYLELECQNKENQVFENINLEQLVDVLQPIFSA